MRVACTVMMSFLISIYGSLRGQPGLRRGRRGRRGRPPRALLLSLRGRPDPDRRDGGCSEEDPQEEDCDGGVRTDQGQRRGFPLLAAGGRLHGSGHGFPVSARRRLRVRVSQRTGWSGREGLPAGEY